MRYVTVKKFCELSGYSCKAVYCKIAEGRWLEGKQYRRAPDGHVMVDVQGVEEWVEAERELA